MDSSIAIKCTHITKKYPIFYSDFERLRALLMPRYEPKTFTALSDVNLTFRTGEITGLIGLNGSGKSTLANLMSGITYPDDGTIEINGEVNVLAANVGMDQHLTGRENIYYKCILMGLSNEQAAELEDSIIEFADIGIHIDQPVRTYSSGMRSRLGFSISVHMEPDILIIDEALSVGDSGFAEKSFDKMLEFRNQDKTIVFVSHSINQMQDFCDRIVWIHHGRILTIGQPDEIIPPYTMFAREYQALSPEERKTYVPKL